MSSERAIVLSVEGGGLIVELPSAVRGLRFMLASTIRAHDETLCAVIDAAWERGDEAGIYNGEKLRAFTLMKGGHSPVSFDKMMDDVSPYEDFYYELDGNYIIFKFSKAMYTAYKTYIVIDDADFFKC